jgi:hypothetical protein
MRARKCVTAQQLSYYNDREHQERMARCRPRPIANKGIGIRIEEPAADLAAIARALHVAGFGPITEPEQLEPALDKAIEIVDNNWPAVVDAITR